MYDMAVAGDDYVASNSFLRSLYQEKLTRDRDRRWNHPEDLPLGPDHSLKLCSLPSQHLGAHLWSSGRQLAAWIAEGHLPQLQGARVLELGAGLGAVGLAASLFAGSAEVVLTDKAEMLPLLKQNIEVNGLVDRCRSEELFWGDIAQLETLGKFDVILAADVVYPTKDPSILFGLRDTLLELCSNPSTCLVLAYKPRAKEDQEFMAEHLIPHFDHTSEDLPPSSPNADDACTVYVCCRRQQQQQLRDQPSVAGE